MKKTLHYRNSDGIKVVIENFLCKVCKMLPRSGKLRQHFVNCGEKIFSDEL